jgi:ankyrin repeat protein
MKVLLVLVSFSVLISLYVLSDKPWFTSLATPNQIEAELKRDPKSVDVMDTAPNEGLTGLMYAAKFGNLDRAKLFVQYGASLNIQAKNENQKGSNGEKGNEREYHDSALQFAILNGNDAGSFAIAKLLIEKGADVMVRNGMGYTCLHILYNIANDLPKRMELMKLLMAKVGNELAQIAYLNTQNNEGNTIIHIGAQVNELDWIDLLDKTYGKMIKYDIRNNDKKDNRWPKGQLPEDLAIACGNDNMSYKLKALREKYAH